MTSTNFERASRLDSLGLAYTDKYFRGKNIIDLEIAIQHFENALEITPADQFQRAKRFESLGLRYMTKYKQTKAIEDLEIAIRQHQESVNMTAANHSSWASRLHFLGLGYGYRYQQQGIMTDTEKVFQLLQEALDMTPANHSRRASLLHDLGREYEWRYQERGKISNLQVAYYHYEEVLDYSMSSVSHRYVLDMILLDLFAEVEAWPKAYQIAFKIVSLVSQLTPHSLETSDKQYVLTNLVELAFNASAIVLNAVKTSFDAVQVLELGRELITGFLNELRTDVFDLQQKHSKLAEEYITLRDQLESPTVSTERHINQLYNDNQQRYINRRYNASQELE